LDFIDYDRLLVRIPMHKLNETLRASGVGAKNIRLEQIDPEGIGILSLQVGGLAGAARAEQEKALRWCLKKSWNV